MKRKKHIISLLLVAILSLTTVCQVPMCVRAKENTKKQSITLFQKRQELTLPQSG